MEGPRFALKTIAFNFAQRTESSLGMTTPALPNNNNDLLRAECWLSKTGRLILEMDSGS